MKSWTITYNAKFTLSFCLLSFSILLLNIVLGGQLNQWFALFPTLSIGSSYRMITYIFCHANFQHLIGNVLILLLLGPLLEEKYGTKTLASVTLITAIITGIINALLFSDLIIGASGIVFMFIVLSSIVNIKEKEIPLTFLLIVIIYLGGEVLQGFKEDNISQFAHIVGGLCGGIIGFWFNQKPKQSEAGNY